MEKDKKTFTILGIETSCDETAASLLRVNKTAGNIKFEILSNVVASQVKIHRKYGGIVPEVAARAHMEKILPVIKQTLNAKPYTLNPKFIDAIAVTVGPGLITSLLVGVEAAKTLSYAWQKPLIPVNHLIGHIYANFVGNIQPITFPAICLVVSGGHTKLILMKGPEKFREIGSTRDDAAGEAFDKVAKLLDIGYPGGPVIARYAKRGEKGNKREKEGRAKGEQVLIKLPRPMIDSGNFEFSFSGLKTAVLYTIKKNKLTKQFINQICAEFQQAVIDVLISKTIQAARKYKAKSVLLAGGVAANTELRQQLKSKVCSLPFKVDFLTPPKNLCTDNAVMIAAAGYFKIKEDKEIKTKEQLQKIFDWRKIKANPNLEI